MSKNIVKFNEKAKRKTFMTLVPWIELKGQWLNQAGFEISTPVKVHVMHGCLVLTAEEA
ncbi:MAG: type I toxin-antitoxin system SymE family toxin [Candidatus Thiodiazotropha sp. (ex Lucinoma kastoroae)]|nr:type I toxin-antitoxin system SymE family toxin [Candidatus Thiodiazotropha sp. (ex Lucinoma kastoroae)]